MGNNQCVRRSFHLKLKKLHTSTIQKWKRGVSWAGSTPSFMCSERFLRFTGRTQKGRFCTASHSKFGSKLLIRRDFLSTWLGGGLPSQNIHLSLRRLLLSDGLNLIPVHNLRVLSCPSSDLWAGRVWTAVSRWTTVSLVTGSWHR